MEIATHPESHTLEIDGMTGDACVTKVTGALKNVQGVTTRSVKVGSATITSDQKACAAACSAITNAGYKARESTKSGESGDSRDAGRGEGLSSGNRSAPQEHGVITTPKSGATPEPAKAPTAKPVTTA